jgi:predicted Zn-dependent protease
MPNRLFHKLPVLAVAAAALCLQPVAANAQTLLRDAEIEQTLRSYADPLITAADLDPKDIKVFLIGDRSMNAFVTGGQQMFYHTGLIMEAEKPIQLKGVIAHETGHIAAGHLARSSEAIGNAMVPAYITMALGLLAIAGGAGDAGMALIASSQQFAMLSFYTYTRVQESNADQLAVTYLEATGQSGRGLLQFFDKFRYQEVMAEARRSQYFRSHPLSADRIAALERRINAQEYKDVTDSPQDLLQLQMMQAKIHGFLEPTARTYAAYPASDQSLPARYARAIATFRAPDIPGGVTQTQALIDEQPDNPWFHELMGQMLFERGQAEQAVGPYRRAVELAPGSALLQIGFARAVAAGGTPADLTEAETALRTALRIEPDNAFAWTQLAQVADARGQPGLARLATAEAAFNLGDLARANRFAQAALPILDQGSPQWRRADDILAITRRAAIRAAREGNPPNRPRRQATPTAAGAAPGLLSGVPVTIPQAAHDHDGHAH